MFYNYGDVPTVEDVHFIITLAEVPGFARGIPRTIKYKCAIIAHHERKAGEMPLIAHHERNANFVHFYDKKMHIFHGDQPLTIDAWTNRQTSLLYIYRYMINVFHLE